MQFLIIFLTAFNLINAAPIPNGYLRATLEGKRHKFKMENGQVSNVKVKEYYFDKFKPVDATVVADSKFQKDLIDQHNLEIAHRKVGATFSAAVVGTAGVIALINLINKDKCERHEPGYENC